MTELLAIMNDLLVMSLGNIACGMCLQREGHIFLGLLLVISAGNIPSHQRQYKKFHESLWMILYSLKKFRYRYGTICLLQCMRIWISIFILDKAVFSVYYFEEKSIIVFPYLI
jgi:hypothetical protein